MIMKINNFMSPNKTMQSAIWPFLLSITMMSTVINFISFFIMYQKFNFFLTMLGTTIIALMWFKDLVRESMMGFHTHKLEISLRVGMLLFILSEIFFFFSFFWAFFDVAMAPSVEYGLNWPPKGITSIPYYSVPLLNTVILLTSGVTVTWSHHALISNDYNNAVISLFLTILLGIYFLIMQFEEYAFSLFTMADGAYGSIFYMATGFHGMHVMVGTLFLSYIMINLISGKLIFNHHFSFEAAAWYWHFVDVVWLFLFLVVYIWFS